MPPVVQGIMLFPGDRSFWWTSDSASEYTDVGGSMNYDSLDAWLADAYPAPAPGSLADLRRPPYCPVYVKSDRNLDKVYDSSKIWKLFLRDLDGKRIP